MTKLMITIERILTLDAGDVAETENDFVIQPPSQPMIDQLIAGLDAMPSEYIGIQTQHLGIGMTALCVRWGTYLATLLDESAPPHPDLVHGDKDRLAQPSFITDGEMMRMNIEVSYCLYRLVQLYRERGLDGLNDLLAKAYLHLPMPQRAVRRDRELGLQLVASLASGWQSLPDSHSVTVPKEYADRTIANVLALWGWRNTEIEDIHAGEVPSHALRPHQRRMRPQQASHLIREISGKFASLYFWFETFFGGAPPSPDLPPWPETATALTHSFLGMQASDWSLTDSSSTIHLGR